jgi:ABC-type multidrug transport system ATPase subunit
MTNPKTFQLRTDAIGKSYGRRVICRSVTLDLAQGQSVAIVGPNGSGKSTFVKILAGLVRPDKGTIAYVADGVVIKPEQRYRHLGLVSPELAMYEELTANENLRFAADVMGLAVTELEIDALMDEFGLLGRGCDHVRTYSSGMRHRLKFVAALLKRPALLLLDEPTVMLDDDGASRVWRALSMRALALVIATNDAAEARRAERQIMMGAGGA